MLHIYNTTNEKFATIPKEQLDPTGMYLFEDGSFYMVGRLYGERKFIHDQMVSSDIWIINHGLKKYPSVTIVDTADNLVIGDINYISEDLLTVTFSASFSGKAYLN